MAGGEPVPQPQRQTRVQGQRRRARRDSREGRCPWGLGAHGGSGGARAALAVALLSQGPLPKALWTLSQKADVLGLQRGLSFIL